MKVAREASPAVRRVGRIAVALCVLSPAAALAQPVVQVLSPRAGDCVNGGIDEAQEVEPGGLPLVPATDLQVRLRLRSPRAGALDLTFEIGDVVVREAQVPVPAANQFFEVEVGISADQLVDGEDQALTVTAASGNDESDTRVTFDIDRAPPTVGFPDALLERIGTCVDGPAPALDYDVTDAVDDNPEDAVEERREGCLVERVITVRDHCSFGGIDGNAARVVFVTRHGPPGRVEVEIGGVEEQARVVAATLSFTIEAGEGCLDGVETRLTRDGNPAGFFGQGQRIDTPGIYLATVEATPCGGAPVRAERRFTVVAAPSADAGGPYEVTQGEPLTLSAAASEVAPEYGAIVEYAWDLNADGFFDPEEGRGVELVYDTLQGDGVYPVGLRITTDRQRREFAFTTVTIADVTPVCDAGGPYEIPQGREVVIDASGSGPGHETEPVIAYDFDFGDDRFPVRGVFPEAGHRYVEEGEYTVTLRVEDIDSFCETTALVTVVDVEPEIRGLAARVPEGLAEGAIVVFTAGLTSAGSAAEPLTEFRWDFGDGSPVERGRNLRDPVHEYVDSGEFEVCLEVDDVDSTVQACIVVVIADLEPFARLDGPRFALEGTPETFSARGSRAGGDADPLRRYVWDFGDGTDPVIVDDIEQTEIEHVFIASGDLVVTLTVEDEDSGTERQHRIFVADVSPDADFVIEGGRVSEGVPAVLDASNSRAGAASDPIVSYAWDFGDGTTGRGERVEHTWADDGVFQVRLTVEDEDGSQGSDQRFVTVRNVPPQAEILTDSDQVEVNAEASFRLEIHDVEADVPVIGWRMGDGTQFANVTQVTHAYDATGIFVVRVRLDDGDGGVTEVERQIQVTGASPSIQAPAIVEAIEGVSLALEITVAAAQIDDGIYDGPVDVLVPVLPRGATWEVGQGVNRIRQRDVVLRWHPGYGDAGDHRVRLLARAPSGLQRVADLVIRVEDAGSAMLAGLGSRGTQAHLGLLRLDFDPLRRLDVFEPVADVHLGSGAGALVAAPDGSRLFASVPGAGSVAVVDGVTGRLLRQVPLGGEPFALAWGMGTVWAFDAGAERMWRVDPETMKADPPDVVPRVRGVLDAAWLDAEGGPSLLAVSGSTGELYVIDPETRALLGARALGEQLSRIIVVDGAVYVADTSARRLYRLAADALLEGAVTTTRLDFAPRDLAWIDGHLWVASDAGLTRFEEDRAVQRRREPSLSVAAIPAIQLGQAALAVGNAVRVTTFTAEDLAEIGAQRGSGARRLVYFVVRP